MKTFLQFIAFIIVIGFIANMCSNSDKQEKVTNPNEAITKENPSGIDHSAGYANAEKEPKWKYSEEIDRMDDKTTYFAQCTSLNEVDFEFPYNGGSTFYLFVRNMKGKNEVILNVDKGQFLPSLTGDQRIKAKFDDGSSVTFSYNSAADGSFDRIFVNSSEKFISKLKNAKKLLIQADFYQASSKYIEFDVHELQWNH